MSEFEHRILRSVTADAARLFCDDEEIGEVFATITIHGEVAGGTSGGGHILGDVTAIGRCLRCNAARLVTRHFGSVLIQIHKIDAGFAFFELAEPLPILGMEPPLAPALSDGHP